jgi:hypothetical protein
MPVMITTFQSRAIHTMLTRLAWMDEKAALVRSFSNGRTASSKELAFYEAAGLEKHLREEVKKLEASLTPQRKKVYWLIGQLGWRDASGGLDFGLLDAFIMAKGVVKRPLRQMTGPELTQTINQLEGVLRNNLGSSASKAVAALKRELGIEN